MSSTDFNVGGITANVNAKQINFADGTVQVTAAIGGNKVNSLNSESGDISLVSSDSSVTITPVGQTINLQGTPAFVAPATKTLYVDGNRPDSYTATGTVLTPFKTIMAAVNQVIANGDNATKPYSIYIASGTYLETIDLSNTALVNISFVGQGVVVGSSSFNGAAVQAINNDNLTDVLFVGMSFSNSSGAPHIMNFSSTTNGTNFGSAANGVGITFSDCVIRPGGTSDVYINNCGNVVWDRCYITAVINVTNCNVAVVRGGQGLNQGSQYNVFTTATPSPAGFSASQIQALFTTCLATVSIDAGSSFIAQMGARIRNTVTVNGLFKSRSGSTSGNVVVNSGGTYTEDTGAGHDGTLTLNGTGAYTQIGVYGVGSLFLNGSQIINGTGSPNGVVVGNPGDLYLNKSGGSITTLWVKETGTNTNTGWSGK
jgi:hypothetical protein